MKKIIAFVAAVVATVSLASAADITVGARGTFGLGVGTGIEDDEFDLDIGKSLDFGFTAFGKIGIANGFAVQPEIGFNVVKIGLKNDDFDFKGAYSNNVLNFAVLAVYDIEINDALTVSPFLGPQVGIVLGKGKGSGDFDGYDVEYKSSTLFDIVLGAAVSYKVGPGAIVGDLRYDLGLIALKDKEDEEKLYTPRALKIGVGYQIKL